MAASAQGPVETEIDGHKLKLGLLSVDESMLVMSQLAKLLGPGVAEATTNESSGAAVLGRIFAGHDPEQLRSLVKKLLRACIVDGKPLFTDNGAPAFYDQAFRGNLVLLFKVAAWALRANLGDFSGPLALLRQRVDALRGRPDSDLRAAASDAGSTSETGGLSGESSVLDSAA